MYLQEPMDRIEILEFITGQLSCGAIPADQEVIKQAQALAAATQGERSDRAWLTLLTRRTNKEHLIDATDAAADRPRVLWRILALLDRHPEALTQFFRIETPSTADVDELFDYLRARVEDAATKSALEPHLIKLVELRPRAMADIANDHFPDSICFILRSASGKSVLEFGEYLLEAGRLKGEGGAAHLKNLCSSRPGDVAEFLANNPGVVRPEDALMIVKEAGIEDAEPTCLEATGDPEAALDAILKLITKAEAEGDKGKE